ncbi:CDP-glycerol glycerophosphotransferase family protein [Ornithinibacillus sp. 4-3]|uniref:CDP-glycerol glycerophosphotransferase family protein n=1 Tax=Ornithinibacillus sp. 4-3 TaxID=3231488 RepID=A0AB39HMS0_9BACI
MKTVSVIIPVYNTVEFLDMSLNSILNQSYNNLEIIIVDDNSNDGSDIKIEEFVEKDKRIKAFHFNTRKGAGAARNYGVSKATGDFVYFLDSDDYLPPKTIELLVTHIGKEPMIRGKMKNTYLNNSFVVLFDGLFNPKLFTDNRFKLLKNEAATNYLIKLSFIKKNKLLFSEEHKIFSDLYFMLPALLVVGNVKFLREALYFKRKRNDPISNPSLKQYDISQQIDEYLKINEDLKSAYKDPLAQDFLDKNLLNFYKKTVVPYFHQTKDIDKYFGKLNSVLSKVQPEILEKHDWFLKREVKPIIKNKVKKYKKIHETHHLLRDMRGIHKSRSKLYRFIYKRVFMKLPLKKDLIFFESFLGKNYSDSPKYIYEYLVNTNDDRYKAVWSFNEKTNIPGNAIQVKRFSLKYFYYVARAKYWVSNSRLPKYLDKREENIYLQTWHGTPLKMLVFDMNDVYSADPKYKENFYQQSRRWDYLSSPNQYSSDIFRRAFKFDKEMLEFGYPRNDILYQKNTDEHIQQIKEKMNLPRDKKIVLYAPTWRDDDYFSRGKYRFELKLDLKNMQNQLGNDYIVLLRMHYFIANQMDISDIEGFAYDFSTYDDIAELYLVSDMLITDYSSVFFDYANLKRPILFFTYDLEKYRDQLRGFYLDIENEVPGPLLMSSNEVINSIKNIEEVNDKYKEKYKAFYERFCKWDDGNASEKTVKTVFKD